MEPAEDRLDDRPGQRQPAVYLEAAMEPAEDRLDDQSLGIHLRPNQWAAMEPAEDRLDDIGTRLDALEAGQAPQWSQPKIGWMTRRGGRLYGVY